MRIKALFFVIITLFLNDLLLPDSSFGFMQQEPQEEIRFNSNLGTFPETVAGVDSLLSIGNEMRERNSRISFEAATMALNYAKKIGYRQGEARAYNLSGNKFLDFGDYNAALEYYMSSYRIEEELGNEAGMASVINNKALVYLQQENYERAAEEFLKAIEIRERIDEIDDPHIAMNNLGVIHRRQGKYDEALIYFRKASEMALQLAEPDSVLYMITQVNTGNTYRNKGEYDNVLGYYDRAGLYFEENGYTIPLGVVSLFKGQYYKDIGEYRTALDFAIRSLELFQQENLRDRIAESHELIAELYELFGDYQKANIHLRNFQDVTDSLNRSAQDQQLQELQIRFDVEQKDREISLQQARISQQEQGRKFLIGGLALLLIILGLMYYNVRMKKKNNLLLEKRRKEIEKKNMELADLNNQKDEFISIAAHDLRNPISVVMTATTLLNSEEKPDKENVAEYSELIQISTDRMLNLVNNMLDIQSVEQKSGDIKREKVDVNEAVEQSILHFKKTAEVKNIELITTLDEDSSGMMLGDRSSLIRILDNLISNAIKYSSEGKRVWISSNFDVEKLLVRIKDEGPGLSEEDQEKLFGRFTSLSSSPTGNESSTGLGLYIAKKLTTSMGGRIWCESEYGEGSVFYLEFSPIELEKIASVEDKARIG